jgi:hypothetical protein
MDFTYGPDPKDWRVWLRHSGDVCAGMFWELVESGWHQCPGAWIENDAVPEYDEWRQDRKKRPIGIKRRVLRRLKAKARYQDFLNAYDTEFSDEILCCVEEEAETSKTRRNRVSWECRKKNMLKLATLLGLTTPEFRHYC